ncbi:MAG: rhodanese-like domain-containing protein [Candidatus Sumerlaeota bacterium]|nr:rhodanese-like domain-containing protein [Candidatus Sumerlaeota bacterium]
MAKSFEELVAEARAGGVEELTLKQFAVLRKAGATMVLIDIREPHEQEKTGKIHGAASIPRGLLEMNIDRHVRNPTELIVLICSDGLRAALAAESLARMGYRNAKPLAGGYRGFQEAILPRGES